MLSSSLSSQWPRTGTAYDAGNRLGNLDDAALIFCRIPAFYVLVDAMITEDEQQTIYLKLRDVVHIFERASMEEKETSFAHWTDGDLAVESRESFDGSIATQFLPFTAAPPEHWVEFKHNRNDRPPR